MDEHYESLLRRVSPFALAGAVLVILNPKSVLGWFLLVLSVLPFAFVLAITTELPWEDWSGYR